MRRTAAVLVGFPTLPCSFFHRVVEMFVCILTTMRLLRSSQLLLKCRLSGCLLRIELRFPLNAQGATLVAVAIDGRMAASIQIADALRPDAEAAVLGLRAMGIRPILLSGIQLLLFYSYVCPQ